MQRNPITLDKVKSHFDHWRATRTKTRERIPKSLWDEVKILIGRYSGLIGAYRSFTDCLFMISLVLLPQNNRRR